MEKNDNNKKREWIKEIWLWIKEQFSKPWIYIILFVISLAIPFTINWLYMLGDKCSSPYLTKWNAEDALSFYGSYLSFLGTVVLGAVTVYQTKKAHQQTEKANDLTEKANELAERMQKLEEARFLSMVSIEDVRFGKAKLVNVDTNKTPFMLPNKSKTSLIDLTNDSKPPECYFIDVIIKNISEFHIGTIAAVAGYPDENWRMDAKRNGIAPNSEMYARILIPYTKRKPANKYALQIHIYLTNVFEYTTHLTLVIKDITNADGKYSYNYDVEKVIEENI